MGSGTNAPLLLAIFTFYIVIAVVLGLYGRSELVGNALTAPSEDPSAISFLSQIGLFFSGIFFSLAEIGVWANFILFTPLALTLLYIILSFFRGSS